MTWLLEFVAFCGVLLGLVRGCLEVWDWWRGRRS